MFQAAVRDVLYRSEHVQEKEKTNKVKDEKEKKKRSRPRCQCFIGQSDNYIFPSQSSSAAEVSI